MIQDFDFLFWYVKRISTRRIISELLKFPKLSNEFFKLITFICEVYPEKVVGLPENVVDQIVLMLKVGLNKWAPQIGSLPCGSSSPKKAVIIVYMTQFQLIQF